MVLVAGVIASRPGVIQAIVQTRDHSPTEEQLALLSQTVLLRAGVAFLTVIGALVVLRRRPGWLPQTVLALSAAQLVWLADGMLQVGPADELLAEPMLLSTLRSAMGSRPGRLCSWPERYGFAHPEGLTKLEGVRRGDLQAMVPDLSAFFGLDNLYAYLPTEDHTLADACGARLACSSPCARRLGARYGIVSADVFGRLPGQDALQGLGAIREPQLVS